MRKNLVDKRIFLDGLIRPYSIENICDKSGISKKTFLSLQKQGLFSPPYVNKPKMKTEKFYPKSLIYLLREIMLLQKQGLSLQRIKIRLWPERYTLFSLYHSSEHDGYEKALLKRQIMRELVEGKRSFLEAIILRKLIEAVMYFHLRKFDLKEKDFKTPKVKATLSGSPTQRDAFFAEAHSKAYLKLNLASLGIRTDILQEDRIIEELIKQYGKKGDSKNIRKDVQQFFKKEFTHRHKRK